MNFAAPAICNRHKLKTILQIPMKPNKSNSFFTRFAKWTSKMSGRPFTFVTAILVILIWSISGPFFHFSDTWQLVINTGTTIVTFLMVFLIQNTQNRDTQAIQIKLDELIRSSNGAHNALLDLEELDDAELERICRNYETLATAARTVLRPTRQSASETRTSCGLSRTTRETGSLRRPPSLSARQSARKECSSATTFRRRSGLRPRCSGARSGDVPSLTKSI